MMVDNPEESFSIIIAFDAVLVNAELLCVMDTPWLQLTVAFKAIEEFCAPVSRN